MKKNQPFPDRPSRDLFPKPFTKHYTERFPWVEKDDKPLTRWNIFCLAFGFFAILGLILMLAYFGNKYGW